MGPLAFCWSHCHHVSLCHGSLTDLGNCLSNVLSQILSQGTCSCASGLEEFSQTPV